MAHPMLHLTIGYRLLFDNFLEDLFACLYVIELLDKVSALFKL